MAVTTKVEVLTRVKARLIAAVSDLNDTNCIISAKPGDPPAGARHNEFVTVSMPGGSFDVEDVVGGGISVVTYESMIAVICWSAVGRQDREAEDEELLLDSSLGLFQLEKEILKALAGHSLEDAGGNLMGENILPISDSDPRVSEDIRGLGDLQVLFSMKFEWDLS